MKRFLSLLLCLVMCFSMFPVEAFADADITDTQSENVCTDHDHDHDHDHDNNEEITADGEGEPEPVNDVDVPPVEPEQPVETILPEEEPAEIPTDEDADTDDGEDLTVQACSHTYTWTGNHLKHWQKCSKCGATTTQANHSWSNKKCSTCGFSQPITSNGTYNVVSSSVTLYSQNNSSSSVVKTVSKGTTLTITNVGLSSSNYYWGKVTKVGTTTQSAAAYVCMKSSDLGTHSHSYSYNYSVKDHSQHTKTGTCTGCGATTSSTENHSWSGNQCSNCNCYKPITSNGVYNVISNSITLYSQNNSSSSVVKTVSKGTALTITDVGTTSSGYYWGKVTKVGTTTQSTAAYVCMKSSELGTHSHSYSYSYEVKSHSQHTKTATCTGCGYTTSSTESHNWSGQQCSNCYCYKPITSNGVYNVISNSVTLYSQNNSSSSTVKTVPQGTALTITDVGATSTGYYWGRVTKVGTTAQSSAAYVCMRSSDLGTHSHSYSYNYSVKDHSQHTKTTTCTSCGASSSVTEYHTWSGKRCSGCGCYQPLTSNGTYIVISSSITLHSESKENSTSTKPVSQGTALEITNVGTTSTGYYWGKVTKIGTTVQSSDWYVCMRSSELEAHTHSYTVTYNCISHSQHTKTTSCSGCNATSTVTESHSWSGQQCSGCGCYKPITTNGVYNVISSSITLHSESKENSTSTKSVPQGTALTITDVGTTGSGYYWGKVTKIGTTVQSSSWYVCMKSSELGAHSHSYSYSYDVKDHSQHTKNGTCSGCGATTSTTENHSWSGSRCAVCGCYKPITSNGVYDVISTNITLHSESKENSTSTKPVPQGTALTITDVGTTSTGYYWGKVTKIGTTVQSSNWYVCMRSSELAAHTHNNTVTYNCISHFQHTKTTACTGCGTSSSVTENHSWSGNRCSGCGCYQPLTSNGTYVVISSSITLHSESKEQSTSTKPVSQGTALEITDVGTTSTNYYWGKVTKIGTTAQSSDWYVCMKSSELAAHTHNYTVTYTCISHSQHTKATTCSGCNTNVSVTENHSWSGQRCSGCGCYKPITSNGVYDVISSSITLHSESKENSTSTKSVPQGTALTITDVGTTGSGYYWGKVTKVGTTVQSSSWYVCMKSSELGAHSHNYSYSYDVKDHSQHTKNGTCSSCGATTSVTENHNWSGGRCSECGCYRPYTAGGLYDVISTNITLHSERKEKSSSTKTVDQGITLTITDVGTTSTGYYWGKVTKIGTTTQTSNWYVCMKSSELEEHAHHYAVTYKCISHFQHTKTTACTGCGESTTATENHNWSGGRCSECGCYQPLTSNGTYVVISTNITLHSESKEQSKTTKTFPQGTSLDITDVGTTSTNYYWGKVTKIDNEAPSSPWYVCMRSSELAAHTHSYTTTYTCISHSQHTKIMDCSGCNTSTSTKENHAWSGSRCSTCGCYKPITTDGVYDVISTSITLHSESKEQSTSTKPVPQGTALTITDVGTTGSGYYWGKVTKIGTTVQSSNWYVCMKSSELGAHSHSYSYSYAVKDHSQHTKTGTCTACGDSTPETENHNWSGNRCSDCGCYKPITSNGVYDVISSSITLYSESKEHSTYTKTVFSGTALTITDVGTTSTGYYWGKVTKIGTTAPSSDWYVCMKSSQLGSHSHTYVTSYPSDADAWHVEKNACSECGDVTVTEKKEHEFVDGFCKFCGHKQVASTPGDYIPYRTSEPLRESPYQDSTALEQALKGRYLKIIEVKPNDYGNFWGKVTELGWRHLDNPLYVYMGNVSEHNHSLTESYAGSNNIAHKKTISCACGYTETVSESHHFEDGICTRCTAWQAWTEGGKYLVINENGVWTYTQPITSGSSSQQKFLPHNSYIEVQKPSLNSANNYWAQVLSIDEKPTTVDMYIYMGRGQVAPHTHSMDTTYSTKSDTQHNKNEACTTCGFTRTEPVSENHDFDSNNKCKCGNEKVANTGGIYVTYRASETLRLDTFEKADPAEKVPSGTCIEVESVITNKYGNYWGVVKTIDGAVPEKTPTYAYMGHLRPHTHSFVNSCTSVNNVYHDSSKACTSCNMVCTERLSHNFNDQYVCTDCTAWQAYETEGDYITIKQEGVPVYSKDITSPKDSRVLDSLPKGTFVHVVDVHPNSANNYWGRVTRVGNKDITQEMYIYMGRGSLSTHQHSMDTVRSSKSDTQHYKNTACTVCGFTSTEPVVEDHVFNNGICECEKTEVAHNNGVYVTVRESEVLRESTYADSHATGNYPKGTALEISGIATNKYGNWWGKVVKINDQTPSATCYAYLGNLIPHTHAFTTTCESVNNKSHKTVTLCSGCNTVKETRSNHVFENSVCKECGAWEAYTADGGYVTIKDVSLYSKNISDQSKGSKELKTLPAGTYIEVETPKPNEADNYWGKVTQIGNYPEKQTMYVYMGRGQLQPHDDSDHSFLCSYVNNNNEKHKVTKVCSLCSYTEIVEEDHNYASDGNHACQQCGAWEPYKTDGDYITIKEGVILYSKRLSDTKKGSKELKTLPINTYLKVENVGPNSAGNYWGQVIEIGNDLVGKTAMYVYMGRGSLETHSHQMKYTPISTSDTQHTYGNRCDMCGYYIKNNPENHQFRNGSCSVCGKSEVIHDRGGYVTVRETESLRSDMYADSKEVRKVPAGTYIEIADWFINDYGNYWGKVSSISGVSVGKETIYTYLGNLQRHASHTTQPYWETKSDVQHKVGERCALCDYVNFTSVEGHDFDGQGICRKCGKGETTNEEGTYVTFRESEPLRESRSKDAKSLQNVPAGTRLQINDVEENSYGNRWGAVVKIDGTDTTKLMYVYMGNVQRHESHDMRPFCERSSDTKHTTGIRCTGCNYVESAEKRNHHFDSNGCCQDCGAVEIPHDAGGYLVKAAGNLKKERAASAGNVQYVDVGVYLEVTDIIINQYGNWWGKVTGIGSSKPKQTNAYVYLGNLTPHTHVYRDPVNYVIKDQDQHTQILECTICDYQAQLDYPHEIPVKGECPKCHAEIPASKAKGDYVTYKTVLLYQDDKLTKPAGVTVDEGYLIKVASVKKITNKDKNVIYSGKVSQYGNTLAGKDKLYVRMAEILPHTTHPYGASYWSRCDQYHYWTHACSVVGCSHTEKEKEERHIPNDGPCSKCGKTVVYSADGVYRVHNTSNVTLYSDRVSSSATAGEATKGSIIVVEQVKLNDAGNYWGKATWVNGKKPSKTAYVYMGSLEQYIRSASVTVSGSDQICHYLRDGNEVFPETHNWQNGFCSGCGMAQNAPATGLHIVKEEITLYTKSARNEIFVKSKKTYQPGSVLQIGEIMISGSVWYGLVTMCDGVKTKGSPYVQIAGLIYHGEHLDGSEYYSKLNDKQHTYDVNCPVCGTNQKVNADHVFVNGVCVFCAEARPYKDTATDYYITVKQTEVYAKKDMKGVLEKLPRGTVLKVGKVEEYKSLYFGTEIQILEDGELTAHKGYIRMSGTWLAVHEHSWGTEQLGSHTEIGHDMVSTCSVCEASKSRSVKHDYKDGKCKVCGANEVSHFTGDYTIQDQIVTTYMDTSKRIKYLDLHEGDYIYISKIIPVDGVYWGKIFQIGDWKLSDEEDVYVPMHSLKPHTHNWQNTLLGTQDNYHVFKSTCTFCNVVEERQEKHIYDMGACSICGKAVIPSSTGMYVAADKLTVYKNAKISSGKVKKNPTISRGTHVYINKVKVETTKNKTLGDGSFYEEIYWGRVDAAGNIKYSGEAWVRMCSLETDTSHTIISYNSTSDNMHSVSYECIGCPCGLKGSVSQEHEFDGSETCILCGYLGVKKGIYYTKRQNCKIYNTPANATIMNMMDCCGTIAQAGTAVEVQKRKTFNERPYCYIRMGIQQVWIDQDDLTDHIHLPAGVYSIVDDEYHEVSFSGAGTVCTICGEEITALNTNLNQSKHSYENGYCKLCGMPEIPQKPGIYYAPYDGYYAYKGKLMTAVPSQYSERGTVYQAGDKIQIEKAPIVQDGIIWGKIKNTSEYVMMKTLSTTPVKKIEDAPLLTDQEVIDWCMNYNGSTPFYTYHYYQEMLGTIDNWDVLLMAVNNRASDLIDQVYKWIKECCGETLAWQYYESQLMTLMTSLEEEAEFSISIPYKKEVKNAIKASMIATDWAEWEKEYNGKLKKCDIEAIKKLKTNLKTAGTILDKGELGLIITTYMTMDFGRMESIIEAARAIQAQATDDPDLRRAFEDVILTYEGAYYLRTDHLNTLMIGRIEKVVDILDLDTKAEEKAIEIIKEVTGFDIAKGWSDWSIVYSTVKFALDLGMKLSDGSKYSKSMLQFMSQISVMSAANDAYSAAVTRIQEGDHSATAVAAVRRQFAAYKVSMVELYDAMIDMASSHILGIGEDNTLINYLQSEKDKLESIYLINDMDQFITGITLAEYRRTH